VIPPLRPDGTLPPGIYQITLDELLIAYPPATEQRQILNDSLRRAVEELRKLDQSFIIYVDGSYVTSKAEPNDVDLLIQTDHCLETEVQWHLEQACPVEAVSLDVNVEPTTSAYLLDFRTTDDYGRAKGIVQLVWP
jgi:hypothetical protein